MPLYKDVETTPDYPKIEEEILKFWKQNKIFQKTQEYREKNNKGWFVFLEGPPTANGLPHVGHVLTRAVKDVVMRYRTMKGEYVNPRRAGWDTHGLPVELEVEKALGLNSKKEIEEYGVAKFNEKCKESVFRYEKEWVRMTERVATWMDMDNPYITLEPYFIESVWWSLKQIWSKGNLYRDYYVVLYCPRCGTPLSAHEVALGGYKDVKDPSIHIKFKLLGEDNTYFLAWTTTPWTLLSNVALAVHPDYDYILVEYKGERLILAKALQMVLEGNYKIIREFKGRELEGLEYWPLFDFVKPEKKAFVVVLADFVTLTEGTGIVHMAPAFGAEDFEVAKKYDLAIIQLVDEAGRIKEEAKPFAGMKVKDADKKIIEALREKGLLFREGVLEHAYPFCWRCDTPLLYYAIETWYIKLSALRENLLRNNEKINWYPRHLKHGRFGNFLEEGKDWALSRNRFWGTPLPIWKCENKHYVCVGSFKELEDYAGPLPKDFDPHRPYVDQITFACPECGANMKREPYVIDCWYDSGAASFAEHHYPFENKEFFEKTFPVTFITEAIDQTRGWFFSLHAVATAVFDSHAYQNVVSLGHVLDEHGHKMSKSKGNVVDPNLIFTNEGADAMRWYFFVSSPPWAPKRFSEKMVIETRNHFLNTLWNVYYFYVTNANIDGFNPYDDKFKRKDSQNILDRWLKSRLNHVIKTVDSSMKNYMIHTAARAIDKFVVDELSNWYIRRSRRRFWRAEMDEDKIAAYHTLFEALEKIVRLLAPFIPLISEAMYQNLSKGNGEAPESVHMTDFPEFREELFDDELEKSMGLAIEISSAGRAARATKNIKLRHPLQELVVVADSEKLEYVKPLEHVLKDELNVKNVKYETDDSTYVTYKLKPNYKNIGPKFKNLAPKIVQELERLDPREAAQKLAEQNKLTLFVGGEQVELTNEEVEVETLEKENYVMGQAGRVKVFLNTVITSELAEEALAREIVRRIQTMRKEMNLDYMQRIEVYIDCSEKMFKEIEENSDYIREETLATILKQGKGKTKGYQKKWKLKEEQITISINEAK
ncbi:MAG: isoleucine--tRNA ligase [Candidatus Jordarchaeaceae archaeon]